jgi:hypothetical protein
VVVVVEVVHLAVAEEDLKLLKITT